jgi:tetratricopeptide (TPR) repeat protein
MKQRRIWLSLLFGLASLSFVPSKLFAQLGVPGGPGFTVFGRVYLPSGKPASRVKVYLEMPNGLNRYLPTDDGGNYEFRGIERGRYKVKAVNPDAPEQYSDPAESDSNRAYANRVQIDVFLRVPMHGGSAEAKAGVVHVTEALIPKAARQAYEQGLKLQKENKSSKALTLFNEAINLYPEYFQALTDRANLLLQQNKLADAEADFAQALKLNGKYVPAWRGIGYCQLQQKKFDAAVRNLENAFTLEPNEPMTLFLLGYGNLSLNRYEEAKQCLQTALQLDEKATARAYVHLGEIFAREQKFKEAADALRAYLKLKPDAADAAQLKALEAKWRAQAK